MTAKDISNDLLGIVDVRGTVAVRADGGLNEAPGSAGFDWTIVALSGVFVSGLFLDGWAHAHGRVDQSFFTPWHAVFYGGFPPVPSPFLVALLGHPAPGAPGRRR